MSVQDYKTSASLNTAISGIYIAENMPRSNVNDAFRQMMADIAVFSSGVSRSIKDGGAVMDGIADDSGALIVACALLGAAGGTITIPNGAKVLINSSVTIPKNVSIVGPHKFIGTPGNNTTADYASMGGALIVNSVATISLSPGASLSGLLIYRAGMTFPPPNSSAFAGTAITIAGDDASVYGCMALGFNKAIYSSGFQRPRIEYFYGDNINGIEITNCLDIPYLSHVHQWPFSNIGVGGTPSNIFRSGNAINLHDSVDWPHLTDCFSWGYSRGIVINNVNSASIVSCGADNGFNVTPTNPGSIGLEILGSCADTRVTGFQSAANAVAAIRVAATSGVTMLRDTSVWGGSTHGILIDSGDTMIEGGLLGTQNAISNGITVNSTSARVFIDGVRFGSILGGAILNTGASSTVFIGQNDFGAFTGGILNTSVVIQGVTAASVMTIPNTGDFFFVGGTTTIGSITNGWAGRTIKLVFGGIATVTNVVGGGNSVRLAGGTNFTSAANSTLTLTHSGGQWYETGRAA